MTSSRDTQRRILELHAEARQALQALQRERPHDWTMALVNEVLKELPSLTLDSFWAFIDDNPSRRHNSGTLVIFRLAAERAREFRNA